VSLFLLTFLLLYGGMHYYAYYKLAAAFFLPVPAVIGVALFMAAMLCAPLFVRLAEREGMETTAMITAYAGYSWMGLLFLFFTASLAIDCGRLLACGAGLLLERNFSPFLPNNRQAFVLALLGALAVAFYGYFEALAIRTEKVVIETGKLPSAIGRLTIVQISDVHLGLVVGKERLRRIIGKIEDAHPDMLVSTGDLVDGQMDSMSDLASELRRVHAGYGKFAVTGNHEYYAGIEHAMDFTRQAGFTVLHGAVTEVNGLLTVAGVDDPSGLRFGNRTAVEKELLNMANQEKFVLLLKHRPVVAKEVAGHFDLQLSGHIHKGQIFPFGLVTRLFYPVRTGFSRQDSLPSLYVSRGTGTWGPPIRFLAPPEVTIIELVNTVGK
jgi:predicted MPP superfamily phosphohydrolase